MGILDRFTKKNQKRQLEALEKKVDVQEPKKKKTAEATKAPAPAPAKSSAAVNTQAGNTASFATLVRPVVSEKAARAEAAGAYTFVVRNDATKNGIKQAVRDVYGVAPKSVRVMNMEGKRVRFGRQRGKRNDWKKAIVTLPKGKSIQIHEGV